MPSEKSLSRTRTFVDKYLDKTGTSRHPAADVTEAVINGLASNLDELGRPLCPCKFFPDKKAEVEQSREWICACDDMKRADGGSLQSTCLDTIFIVSNMAKRGRPKNRQKILGSTNYFTMGADFFLDARELR